MSVRVSAEEMETTGSEKVLAVVLAAFILVGFIWAYVKLEEIGEPAYPQARAFGPTPASTSPAIRRNAEARTQLSQAVVAQEASRQNLELSREAFRTALDAGQPAGQLQRNYQQAQQRYRDASAAVRDSERRVAATQPAASAVIQRNQAGSERALAAYEDDRRAHDRQTFALRLLLVLVLLGSGYWLLSRLRLSRSRYLPAGLAWVVAAAALALVMAGDYTEDYIEFSDVGPLAISIAGIAMTMAAFVALQRYLKRRMPLSRVRRGLCPFCGFPVGPGEHCEGCGRTVRAPCGACQRPRRVGTQHCAACGMT